MNLKHFFRMVLTVLFLSSLTVFVACFPLSCRVTEEGIEIISAEMSVPKILSFFVEDSSSLVMVCSEKVSVQNVQIKSDAGEYIEENSDTQYFDDGKRINFLLKEPTEVGMNYIFSGSIKDSAGNELTFSLPFTGFNEKPARLVLSEIRSKHSTSKGMLKKCEFVEVYVLKDGSTAGLEIVTGSDGESKKYVFPDINVKKGEYIVVHFRTLDEGECIDELVENLSLSTGTDSSNSRDLWVEGKESRISDSDVIVIRDSCRNILQDAVLFSATGKQSWYYTGQKSLALEAYESGIWKDGYEPKNSVIADGISLTRTMCRMNIEKLTEEYSPENDIGSQTVIETGTDDWSLVEGATPGAKNSEKKYEKTK